MKNHILLVVFLLIIPFSFSNGIWTYAEDIRAGVFGEREVGHDDNFTFDNIVYFNRNIFANSDIILNSQPIRDVFVEEGQINSITTDMLQDNAVTSNEIAEDSVRLQELDTSSVDTRYVNRAGDSMTGDLNMGSNRVNAAQFRSSSNSDFFLNPSGVSNLHRIVADRIFSPGTNSFFLNPSGETRLNQLRVNNIEVSGQNTDERYVMEGQSNSITNSMLQNNAVTSNKIAQNNVGLRELDTSALDDRYVMEGQSNSITNSMLQNNAVTTNKIASDSVRVQELDTNSVDARYLNRAGDSMTGDLNMGGNRITNVGSPTSNNDVATRGYVHSVAGGAISNCFMESGTGTITNPNNPPPGLGWVYTGRTTICEGGGEGENCNSNVRVFVRVVCN